MRIVKSCWKIMANTFISITGSGQCWHACFSWLKFVLSYGDLLLSLVSSFSQSQCENLIIHIGLKLQFIVMFYHLYHIFNENRKLRFLDVQRWEQRWVLRLPSLYVFFRNVDLGLDDISYLALLLLYTEFKMFRVLLSYVRMLLSW